MSSIELSDPERRWLWKFDLGNNKVHFGLDSEGSGREGENLLAGPPAIVGLDPIAWSPGPAGSILGQTGGIRCELRQEKDLFEWRFRWDGKTPVDRFIFELVLDSMQTPTVLLPSTVGAPGDGFAPWLLVAPDFGHLCVEGEPKNFWVGTNSGQRGYATQCGPIEGSDPKIRGQALLERMGPQSYVKGSLLMQFRSARPPLAGEEMVLRFRPQPLADAEGIDPKTWKRLRRAYLNHWQPCGAWNTPERTFVLGNNVLSDPASISLIYYAEPMLFYREPVPGIDLSALLRHSLDYHLDHEVSAQGHVNAFGKMYDLYVHTGAILLSAAWTYWEISKDKEWLGRRIETFHRMADYLLRRDGDGDGLIESIGSGNAGTLRDPERADIWYELVNFGHKNSWTNVLAYRAFLNLAEMLEAYGEPKGAAYYRKHAARLRQAFAGVFLSKENGWLVSWISLDGEVHDYCHIFTNGLAVAYGLVDPALGRQIMERVCAQSKRIGFENWQLGVPGNLLPCRRADLIGPSIGLDGEPKYHPQYSWPEGMGEKEAFGHRYPNGTIHPGLTWMYILGLQVAGMHEEADRIVEAMTGTAERGGFQNGVVNAGYCGAEHFYINGRTCGYEGYLPESWNFLMAPFTRGPAGRDRLLRPLEAVRK